MAFTVNFSESVANISTDDFTLVSTGSAAGSIASVSASTGSSVDVNITGISGTGKYTMWGNTTFAITAFLFGQFLFLFDFCFAIVCQRFCFFLNVNSIYPAELIRIDFSKVNVA